MAKQDFGGSSSEIGGFASAVTEAPVVEQKPVIEQQQQTAAPVVEEKAVVTEKPVVQETVVDDNTNPNLAAKVEKKVEEEDKIPEGMTKPAQETWKKIKASEKQARAERDAAKQEGDAIRAELAESGKTKAERDSLKAELEAKRKEIAEYESEIAVVRVEATKAFKAEVTAPQKDITDSLIAMAERYEIPKEGLLNAIREPDAAKRSKLIDEATEDLSRSDQFEVVQAAKDWHRSLRKAEEMRADASKTLEEITRRDKENAEKATSQTTADYRSAVGEQLKTFQEMIPEIRKVDGHKAWNEKLDKLQRDVEAIDVNDLPVESVARGAVAEKILPEVLDVLKHFKAKSEKLEKELAAEKARVAGIRGATPGAGAGGNGNGGGEKKDSRLFSEAVFDRGT